VADSSLAASPAVENAKPKVTLSDYRNVGLLFAAFGVLLAYIAKLAEPPAPDPNLLLGPVFALVALVLVVWLLMVVVRNVATIRGLAPPRYYEAYTGPVPEDWIERPARTFNNLMQVPTLFYVVCTLMLVTQHSDRAQLAYAWLFVALRALHAVVYIGWNPLPYRFATWIMASVTLFTLWTRFALQAWPGL
jgi:hypothetical protein